MLTSLLRAYTADAGREALYQEAVVFSDWLNTEPINKTARDLALVVHQLIMAGEQESEIGKNILQSIVTTMHDRQQSTSMAGIH